MLPFYWIERFSLLILIFLVSITNIHSQNVTKVEGTVMDRTTKELLPFVNISFKGTAVGTSTDLDGYFELSTKFPSDTLVIEYLGYTPFKLYVAAETNVKQDFYLSSETLTLNTVDIVAKKEKYSKKNNPSLELMKKVRENKNQNHIKEQEFYSMKQYDKVRLDLNNITDKFKSRSFIKDFDFLWDFIDTSSINGRTFLPVFMREILSTQHYRKSTKTEKEVRHAINYTKVNDKLDPNSLNSVIDLLYTDIDIYEEQINLLENNFVSPISNTGENFYRYYIQDTIDYKDSRAIKLSFIPADKGDFGFTGNLYISDDDRYTVLKVDMGIINGINLNFVRDINIIQEFEQLAEQFVTVKDEVTIDYSLSKNGIGFFGTRSLFYSDFDFSKPADDSIFNGLDNVILEKGGLEKDSSYWDLNRLVPLGKNDAELYAMMDTLRNNRRYQAYVLGLTILTTGYIPLDKVEIGKIATFANFNDVEGWTLRFGMGTKRALTKKIRVRGDISRAIRTNTWKWYGQGTYTFNGDWLKSPKHEINFSFERGSSFPGQELENFNPENLLLSFRRGEATRMLMTDRYDFSYIKEANVFSYEVGARIRQRSGIGSLSFNVINEETGLEESLESINTTEAYVSIRFAPNEQYVQGKDERVQLQNEFPIITLQYARGINELFEGQYDYHKLYATIFKQIEWTEIGVTNFNIEGGKTWGEIPYLLQWLPRGNQTYAYQLKSYNLMNFLEFTADQFVSFQMEHYFVGYFFNNIPLLRRLKLREIVTVKAYYGSLSDENNPNFNPSQVQFSKDALGQDRTFAFGDMPYLEGSFGVSNIFKIFRLDLVQRFTYLDNPDVPQLFGQKGMAVRMRFQVEF